MAAFRDALLSPDEKEPWLSPAVSDAMEILRRLSKGTASPWTFPGACAKSWSAHVGPGTANLENHRPVERPACRRWICGGDRPPAASGRGVPSWEADSMAGAVGFRTSKDSSGATASPRPEPPQVPFKLRVADRTWPPAAAARGSRSAEAGFILSQGHSGSVKSRPAKPVPSPAFPERRAEDFGRPSGFPREARGLCTPFRVS
jgi:hypothetical protein